jgi:maltooligosyltrehalose synthase
VQHRLDYVVRRREVEWLRRLWPDAPGDVEESLCALPVYRTYIGADGASAEDLAVLREAGVEWIADGPEDFVRRWQQTTPPVMAKGVEDTAFYRYGRLLALNDVGGDPGRFGLSAEDFHRANTRRRPLAMTTLQTHDTKRSADVRARLAAITWIPGEWVALAEAVLPSAPDRDEGWFFLQTVVAAPVSPERLSAYVEPWSGRVEDADREAVAEASLQRSLSEILLLERPGWDAFVTRFQQTTPPVMAKGVEDTAFYRYVRLLALNDVGGDPGRFSISVDQFHAANAARSPLNLLVTQTHDTKRSGDVRARIGALASMPEAFAGHVRNWLSVCRSLTSGGAPDPVVQLFIFQPLLGAWPVSVERLEAYLEKALREAKVNTSWVEPNEAREAAVKQFARALYTHRDFLRTFEPFQREVAEAGDRMALGQLLLKLTVPGVPDIYQGDELLNLALVDPDNRRPVDWEERRAALSDPPPKLRVIQRTLALRISGAYEPVDAGPDTVAFLRGGDVFVSARLRGDAPLSLPPGDWTDVLELDYAEFGIALLKRT